MLLVGKAAPERGGIPSYLEMLLERLPPTGHEAELLNLADAAPRVGGSMSGANLVATGRDLVRLGRLAAGFDVVHVHSACAPGTTLVRAGALCAVARLRGARTILHVHGGRIADWLSGPRRRRLARVSLRGIDRIVAVASTPARVVADALGRDVPVIPNGVDLRAFRPADAPEPAGSSTTLPRVLPTILMVGSLTPRKGVLDLLEASQALRARGVEHRLLLAGGTPDDGSDTSRQVTAAVEAAGDHVQVVPSTPHDEMPALYQRAQVFCLPSWWEAQPLSLLEAMSCGVASVVTDVGDVRSMTDDGRAASIVPPRDVAALTDAIAGVLSDPGHRRSLAAAGRACVEVDRDLDRVVGDVVALYRTAVSGVEEATVG